MKIEDFCRKLGSTAVVLSNNWYETILRKIKYKPFFVIDLKSNEY